MSHVELDAITKSFGAVSVLPPLSLSVGKGEFVVLVGPSGCGKTTTLRILAGLETATSGQVRINGRDVTHMRPGERNTAMVFQNYALYPHMTVRGNIGYAMKVHGVPFPTSMPSCGSRCAPRSSFFSVVLAQRPSMSPMIRSKR